MNKSLLLLLALALVSLGASESQAQADPSGTRYGSSDTGSHDRHGGGDSGTFDVGSRESRPTIVWAAARPSTHHGEEPGRAVLGGPDAPDPCVENYYSPRSANPCEEYYSPRKCVHHGEPSPTQGPHYDNNSNEWRSRKLMRGITNVTMAVGEIPAGAFREAYATSPVTGAVVGGAHGAVTAVKRIGIGFYEILTFPFALNMKQTGERVPGTGDAPHAIPDPAQWDQWGWGTLEGVDSCCNKTRGTFAPYMEPEIVWMDSLPSCE